MKTNIREYHVELINFKLSQIETINKANAFINHPNLQKAYNVLVEELNNICDDLVYEVSEGCNVSSDFDEPPFIEDPFAGLDLIDHTDTEIFNEDKFKNLANIEDLFTFEHEKNEK